MSAQPIPDAILDDEAAARAARRAQQQHRRAEREKELGLPPRPNLAWGGARLVPDMRWTIDAACVGAPDHDLHVFTEATNQLDAGDVVEVYCAACPVARECIEAGRELLAWGVWGGHVLTDGWLAPERPAKPRGPRQGPTTAPVPEGTGTVDEPVLDAVAERRTQRWQPVGRRRARRRRRR